MLVEKIQLQELLDDILELIQVKSEWESNKTSRKNNLNVKKISKKIQNKYLKTSNSETVIDLINTISNNNDIIDLKPSNIKEIIKEDKKLFIKELQSDKDIMNELISKDILNDLMEKNQDVLISHLKKKKSLILKNNTDKYYELLKLYSAYHSFSEDIYSEEYLMPLIEEAFLDDDTPEGWDLCFDDKHQRYYYYNYDKDEAVWNNPSIQLWKNKIDKKRQENEKYNSKKYIKIKKKETKKTPIKINDEDILLDLENYNFSGSEYSNSPSSSSSASFENNLRRSPRIRDLTNKKKFVEQL